MRIPLVPDISSRDGSSIKNARMRNVLQQKKPTGQILAVVRPGLTVAGTASGDGMGVYCWQREGSNSLIGIYDDVVYQYSVSFDNWIAVWRDFYTYSIGDIVIYNETIYYSYIDSNQGNSPASPSSPYWDTSAPPSTRYYCDGAGYDSIGGITYPHTSPNAATKLAAATAWSGMLIAISCVTKNDANSWLQPPVNIGGNFARMDRWHATGGNCSTTINSGQGDVGTIHTV